MSSFLLYPFILFTNFITKNLHKNKGEEARFSKMEFRAIADSVIEEGVIENEESRILQNLMKFQSIQVKSIMTPQIVIEAEEESTPIDQWYEHHQDTPFSRIPIYTEELQPGKRFCAKG